jgi:imidazole glycerol-phosphate synthase subunit HisH
MRDITIAIVDYGVGNLFSVSSACHQALLHPVITSSYHDMLRADAVILPGMGAFGDAMSSLRRLDLVDPLREFTHSGKLLVGICLGMQLLMSESYEFGSHEGLGILAGSVIHLAGRDDAKRQALKVPHIGWNQIYARGEVGTDGMAWRDSPLANIASGEYMYFVHSYHAVPADRRICLSTSRYQHIEFCSSVWTGNIFACQFHPERSAASGLQIYRNIAAMLHADAGASIAPSVKR